MRFADRRGRYIDAAAKKAMQEDEEFHACPNAACSWGIANAG